MLLERFFFLDERARFFTAMKQFESTAIPFRRDSSGISKPIHQSIRIDPVDGMDIDLGRKVKRFRSWESLVGHGLS